MLSVKWVKCFTRLILVSIQLCVETCRYNGWLVGYQTVFDTAKSKVTQNNFAVGYSKDDITLHTAVSVCYLRSS